MVSSKRCPACDEMKRRAESDPEIGKDLVVLDVEESQLARDLAEIMDVRGVPFMVSVHKKDDRTFLLCRVDDDECLEVELVD